MQDKSLYLIAEFDDNTQSILSGYYEVLQQNGFVGNQTKNIPYHFTLGNYKDEFEIELEDRLHKICSETDHFDINLSHIGLFGLDVLFIEPNMNFELLALQQKFFPDCGKGYYNWTAHATLLIDKPEVILKALPIVSDSFKPFKARIESVSLYEFFPKRFIQKCVLNG